MKPGDRITGWNGTAVWTFGDLQYVYDKVDRKATHIQVTVDRNGESAVLEDNPARTLVVDRPAFPAVERGAADPLRGSCFDG